MTRREGTREPQYRRNLVLRDRYGIERLGLGVNQPWRDDPRHVLFSFARYKFAAKMLEGLDEVLEVGCGDAFATRLVCQSVARVTAIDFDPVFIRDAQARPSGRWPLTTRIHDITRSPMKKRFDGAYALDVLEHIPPRRERAFLRNVCASLKPRGVLLIGTPSLESQRYASKPSRAGHVNCKTGEGLSALLRGYFHHVFLFSMNDEVVHTGFARMAHYLLALCCEKRR